MCLSTLAKNSTATPIHENPTHFSSSLTSPSLFPDLPHQGPRNWQRPCRDRKPHLWHHGSHHRHLRRLDHLRARVRQWSVVHRSWITRHHLTVRVEGEGEFVIAVVMAIREVSKERFPVFSQFSMWVK